MSEKERESVQRMERRERERETGDAKEIKILCQFPIKCCQVIRGLIQIYFIDL